MNNERKGSWRRALSTLLVVSAVAGACNPVEASPTPEGCTPPAEAGNPARQGETVVFQWQQIYVTQTPYVRSYVHDTDRYTFTYTNDGGKIVFSGVDAHGNPIRQWASTDKNGALLLAFPLDSKGKTFGPVFVLLCSGTSSNTLYFDEQFLNTEMLSQPQASNIDLFFPTLRPPISINLPYET